MYKQLSASKINEIFRRFKEQNPHPATELIAPNDFCLLVAVVLSAQTTDKAVNKATASLFDIANTPQTMLDLGAEGLTHFIKSIGLYRNKTKFIIGLSQMILDEFNGNLPDTRETLMQLPGVGRKTANVIMNVVYNQPTMPVDTHILRISPKIGLCPGETPAQIEAGLIKKIPSEYMNHAHHWLVLHGRYVCVARTPHCEECLIQDLCAHNIAKK
ncbi:MAG: endonuclease III [Treponema sp. CETP13]|nr:MAG: endonuclease III [Treponema sp. CETP13]